MEQWKPVKDYEGLYWISDLGNIKSAKGLKRKATQINGYEYVTLYKNGKQSHKLIHRLVAEAFLPNPDMLPEVNHISENKLDNSVNNLEWCTHKYNHNFGTGHDKSAEKQGRKVKLEGEIVKIHESVREAARSVGKSHKDIYNVCNGRRNTSSGFRWEYA